MSKSDNMKKLVLSTLAKYSISNVDETGLKTVIAGEGYTVIRFSKIGINDQTERLLTALGLEERAVYNDSFTYNDIERRIIFIRKDISDDEFLYLLAVELGRVLSFKTSVDNVIGLSAEENRNAHEFAHHMLDLAEHGFIYNFFKSYTVQSIVFAVSAIITLSIVVCFFAIRGYIYNIEFPAQSVVSDVNKADINTSAVNSADVSQNIISNFEKNEVNIDNDATKGLAESEIIPVDENNDSYELSEFYSTRSGKKYHTKDCGYIKGKEIVPVLLSNIETGEYTACSRCIK